MATFATDKELNASTHYDVHLGVSSFSAISGVEDRDIKPATATTDIFGRFQSLKTLLHPNLCEYVEIVKGKHDRLFVVFEYHSNHLGKLYQRGEDGNIQVSSVAIPMLREWAFQILKALAYLNKNVITHHNLAPNNILLDSEGKVKLSDYGLYYMSKGGANVDFPIGYPHYLPPEAVYRSADKPETTGKVDVWSLGIILAEIYTGNLFWQGNDKDIDKIFSALWQLQMEDDVEVWERFYIYELGISDAILEFLQGTDDDDYLEFRKFVRACLEVNVSDRYSPEQLLSHPFFSSIYEHGLSNHHKYWWVKPFLQSQKLELDDDDFLESQEESHNKDVLDGIPLSQIYYFWKLAGGDVETELAKRGYLLSTPPIERIPRAVKVHDGKEEGTINDTAFLYSDTNYSLSLKELRQRLEMSTGPNRETFEWDTDYFHDGDEDDMNFLADEVSDEDSSNSEDVLPEKYLFPDFINKSGSTTNGTTQPSNNVKLPLLIREKDVGYQFQRVALFTELLREYPSSRDEIIHHAKVDIPPFLRGKIWAAILGVKGDYQAVYDSYDKETEKETDRQIDVDVPRCHQYHQLLSSPIGHEKLRRLLKCFVAANDKLVYWQGLDSLSAPFLTLNFNDEALAFNCLHTFIPKFHGNFFLYDNTQVIQEYLAVFRHLLSFHDPELSSHLNKIGYQPDLYAIPWILTLFTHVFPLDKTYHLWDKILVGPPSLPLFAGISILRQLRDVLIKSEFNDCIMIFSESFPDVDIEKCIQSALSMFKVTPPSVIYRVHETHSTSDGPSDYENQDHQIQRWWEQPTPVETKKIELAPRISLKDLVRLRSYALVIDTRSEQEFARGHFPLSVNMNPAHLEQLSQILWQEKKKYHVVVGKRGDSGPQFAADLVNASFPRVAVLTGGIDVMRVDAEEGVVVCACRPIKLSVAKSKDGPIAYWRCEQNLMKQP
ncbi:18674_t:CDS:10 [Acaulospora morrowiae]|uniref:18674_t:CDS:1 n=1 Tax=Acaulospora morrowiae TaxID=94023 RepID=A0A9N9FQE2_9GLOM|nr:18674_t:CDS:10 [Acaulospora morrowiae]